MTADEEISLKHDREGAPLSDDQLLALAVLLLKLAEQDHTVKPEERAMIVAALASSGEREAEDLLRAAEALSGEREALMRAAEIVSRDFSSAQRERIVNLLSIVAAADGEISSVEEQFTRMLRSLIA